MNSKYPNPGDYALVIGLDHYHPWSSLLRARADAWDFAEWLCDRDGGGLLPENCHLIHSRPGAEYPSQEDIDRTLRAILSRRGPARRLYVYYAGHGSAADDRSVNLCLGPCSRQRPEALDSEHYIRSIIWSGKFEEIMVFFDCCRSRVRATGLPYKYCRRKPHPDAGRARVFRAYATEFQREALDEPRGVLTAALLEGLRGAAAQGAYVTAPALQQYLLREIPRMASDRGYPQNPVVENPFTDAVVIGGAVGWPVVQIQFTREAEVRLLGQSDSEITGGPVRPGHSWTRRLPNGLYTLQVLEPQEQDLKVKEEHYFRVQAGRGVIHVVF
jgi:hypothetical protein